MMYNKLKQDDTPILATPTKSGINKLYVEPNIIIVSPPISEARYEAIKPNLTPKNLEHIPPANMPIISAAAVAKELLKTSPGKYLS